MNPERKAGGLAVQKSPELTSQLILNPRASLFKKPAI